MNHENADILNRESILESLTRTLLYEGYALYPYLRSAIKNQKPVPFGVVYPLHYNIYNVHAHSKMQTQCIVTGSDDLLINISVRFLHFKKIELFERTTKRETAENDFVPVYNAGMNGKSYQAGWQTIERKLSTGDLHISQLIKNREVLSIDFDEMQESKYIYDESSEIAVKQVNSVSEIKGAVIIEVSPIENIPDTFQVTIRITNTTFLENAGTVTRDEVLSQSFLSTHTILETTNATFISHQNPDEKWKTVIAACQNINTWPILIDEKDTALLSSPVILYDYPKINAQSQGDLFDSTEIEEALLLHISVLSDDEKERISQSDEKLQAMLNKVNQVTPEELIGFHNGLKDSTQNQIGNRKKSEL